MQNTSSLKSEIEKTLEFFIESDISIYGKVSRGTIESYEVQEIPFPDRFKHLLSDIK